MVLVARVWVTGSVRGIGRAAAEALIDDGHDVLLHARNEQRADKALAESPGAIGVVVGDFESMHDIRRLADAVAEYGPFDAVIHNAGVMEDGSFERPVTVDGLERTFSVNVLAPYLLTALMPRPERLVFMSSGMHMSARPDLDDWQWERRRYNGTQAYSDSKLAIAALGRAVAERHPDVLSNVVDPGWVRTRMGGASAPVSPAGGAATAIRLATDTDASAKVSGKYFARGVPRAPHKLVLDRAFQDSLLATCEKITDTPLR